MLATQCVRTTSEACFVVAGAPWLEERPNAAAMTGPESADLQALPAPLVHTIVSACRNSRASCRSKCRGGLRNIVPHMRNVLVLVERFDELVQTFCGFL
eukprot:CAMPEP_0202052808 /NCGR_PEP_ID=MMETSP0963-20130614/5484_1 /ASSEMBLY_ACC=CAM_ASM_000494 /TAXON_ID=4773 /ORGANISM="Schizochytrium aggregatum, Strain ATCC28209" /LENGTH=98 /DNA_ID=CAMNT_0048618107 /DNA_START=111 /DNA_END=404 /DNA_ORIENTATION=+